MNEQFFCHDNAPANSYLSFDSLYHIALIISMIDENAKLRAATL